VIVLVDERGRCPLDKVFAVVVGSELYGESVAVVRYISGERMLVTTNDILYVGTVVTVHFHIGATEDEVVARAEVAELPAIELAIVGDRSLMVRGMWLRFLDFDENLPLSLPGSRVLH
jgi:hypothetical protein